MCREVIATHTYSGEVVTMKWDFLVIKLMQEMGWDNDKVYSEWSKIYENYYLEKKRKDDYFKELSWKYAIVKASKMKKLPDPVIIKMYQSDIDFVNGLNYELQPMWIKKAVLVMIAYLRFSKKKSSYTVLHNNAINRINRHKEQGDLYKFTNVLMNCGILAIEKERVIPKGMVSDDDVYERNKYVYKAPEGTGDVLGEYEDIDSMFDLFEKIDNKTKCEKCGEVFEYNSWTKRCICKKCAKHEDRINLTSECACEQCGKMFTKNSKTKRNVCFECWNIMEKNRLKEKNAKRRGIWGEKSQNKYNERER